GIGRAPASAGPRRLARLRARPALSVSVGEQQSHYCDTEQNKTDRAHAVLPVHVIPAASSWRTPPSQPRARSLFDHLVGAGEQRWRDGQAERLGGDQIDDEIELGRLLDRQVAG